MTTGFIAMNLTSSPVGAVALIASLATGILAGCGGGDEPLAQLPAVQAVATAQPAPPMQVPALHAAVAASAPRAPADPAAWHFAAAPADVRVAPGEAAAFTVRAEGGSGAFEYQWLRDGEPIDGANASQYGFVTTLDDGGATFAVRVRPRGAGPGHERESAPATLSWREPAN
jgi:hypothetical protein